MPKAIAVPPMDPKLIPRRALLDTGVLIRALGEHPTDPRSSDCREFLDAMVAEGSDILIAAPSLAEMIRAMAVPKVPTTNSILVVPFDDQAAIALGTTFPMATLKSLANQTGFPLTFLKYDALIAACAIRHKAEFLVSIDGRMSRQIPSSLKVASPSDFRAKQLQLATHDGGALMPGAAGTKPSKK